MIQWNVAPAQEGQALVGDHVFDVRDAGGNGGGFLRQEYHAHTVFSLSGQRHAQPRSYFAEKGVGHLDQYAGAVAGVRVGTGGAAMPKIVEHLQGFDDDGMGLIALDVGHHADAARVMLMLR